MLPREVEQKSDRICDSECEAGERMVQIHKGKVTRITEFKFLGSVVESNEKLWGRGEVEKVVKVVNGEKCQERFVIKKI